jgi:hypothetical protein
MTIQFITPYINKDIRIFDRRDYPFYKPEDTEYNHQSLCYLHQIHYFTDLPKIFELGDAIDTNAFHLFVFMLARLYYIDDGSSDVIFYYPSTNSYLPEAAFKYLDKRFKRIYIKDTSFEYVELPGCKWHYDYVDETWLFPYVKNLYKHIWNNIEIEKGKRTYISRKNAQSRHVLNEAELLPQIKKLGFSTYYLEDLTFVDQIKLFASSEFISGPHGAGLIWMLFAHKETTILEINSMNGKNHYKDIAIKMNLKYYRFIDVSIKQNNFNINIETYIHAINALL